MNLPYILRAWLREPTSLITLWPHLALRTIHAEVLVVWYLWLTANVGVFQYAYSMHRSWKCVDSPIYDHTDNCMCDSDCGVGLEDRPTQYHSEVIGWIIIGIIMSACSLGFLGYQTNEAKKKIRLLEKNREAWIALTHGNLPSASLAIREAEMVLSTKPIKDPTARMIALFSVRIFSLENMVLDTASWGYTGRTPHILRRIVANLLALGFYLVYYFIEEISGCPFDELDFFDEEYSTKCNVVSVFTHVFYSLVGVCLLASFIMLMDSDWFLTKKVDEDEKNIVAHLKKF